MSNNKKIIVWSLFLFAGVLSLVFPENPIPPNKFSLDKIMHFTFYFVLTLSTFLIFNVKNKGMYKIVIVFFILAAGLEYVQLYIPHREFSYNDMMMNFIGIIIGIILFKIITLCKNFK